MRSFSALLTFEIGLVGVALCIAAVRGQSFPITGAFLLLTACLAARLSPVSTAILAVGALAGWFAARTKGARGRLFVGACVFAYTGVVLMLAGSARWPLGHPNHHAMVVAAVWGCQLGALREGPRSGAALANALGLSASMATLVFVFHRGQAVLAIACVSGFALLSLLPAPRRWRVAAWGFGAVLVLALSGAAPTLISWLADQLGEMEGLEPRLRIWRVALAGWSEAPFVGLGPWGMHHAMATNDWARVRYWGDIDWASETGNAHNLVFQLLVQGGLLGLVTAVVVAGAIVRLGSRASGADVRGATWSVVALAAVAIVSVAPFSEVGLLTVGLLLGFLGTRGAPWLGERGLRLVLPRRVQVSVAASGGLALLLFCGVRPLLHEGAFRVAPVRAASTLPWLVWSDATYAALVNHLNVALHGAGNHAELYELQIELIDRYGPRRLSLTNAAKAALAAGRPERAIQHCIEHLRWDPLLDFAECPSILSALGRLDVAGPALDQSAAMLTDTQRHTLSVITGREPVDTVRLGELLARSGALDLEELSYLVAAAQKLAEEDPTLAIHSLTIARDRARDAIHLPARIAEIRLLSSELRSATPAASREREADDSDR